MIILHATQAEAGTSRSTTQASEPVKMGEGDEAMEYDQDLIFKHLSVLAPIVAKHCWWLINIHRCFYLDSPSNAKKNRLDAKAKHADELESQ